MWYVVYVSTSGNGEYKPPIEASSSSERALFEGKEDKKSESITDFPPGPLAANCQVAPYQR